MNSNIVMFMYIMISSIILYNIGSFINICYIFSIIIVV